MIALTNQRPVTETEGQGQVQTGYLLFVSLMIVSTMFAFSTFFTFSFLQIEFTSLRIFERIILEVIIWRQLETFYESLI